MSNFWVGQKVVCIHAFMNFGHGIISPQKNAIYTIREKTFDGTCPGLRFVEIVNPPFNHSNVGICEPAFEAIRFRPLVTRKTDISIFTRILTDCSRRERVPT